MPRLFLIDSKQTIGEITQAQLEDLRELLVEEDSTDREFFVDKDTLEMLKDEGVDEEVLTKLQTALADQEGIDIGWATS